MSAGSQPRLAIVGLSGRMGLELLALAPEFGFEVVAGVARGGKTIQGVPTVATADLLFGFKPEVVIDFSLPELTPAVARACAAHKKPLVSGVTGLTSEQKGELVKASGVTPIFWAPNMSLGVAVVARMLNEFSKLEGFDFQIEELHHTRKKDKPSGTALFLQDKLKKAVSAVVPEPMAIRGGGIFGIHRVWAMGEEETITLEHNAMNRRVFARGAFKAAKWILQQKSGLYSMDDVLTSSGKA